MQQLSKGYFLHLRRRISASALAAIMIGAVVYFYPNVSSQAAPSLSDDGLGVFSEIYEPSGVIQLADNRVLIVEDEVHRAMRLLTIAPNGALVEHNDANEQLTKSFDNKLSDLEAAATDHRGYVYATTSHSNVKKNKRDEDRERLLRFRVQGNSAMDVKEVTSLRDDLEDSKIIVDAIKAHSGDKPDFEDLDIEGMAYNTQTNHLVLGLRTPRSDEMSIIIPITNPDKVFDKGESPKFAKPIFLDLDDGGIRSLHFNSDLNKYVIANEVENKKGKNRSKVWTWSGDAKDDPVLIDLPELDDLRNIEGIAAVTVNGQKKLLFTPDEGVEKKEKPAKYRYFDLRKFR